MPDKPNARDVRKPHTPPAGVRAQTAQPELFPEDELTPVEGDPVSQISQRSRQAVSASREAASSSKAAFTMIREVRQEVRAYNERDEADHVRLFANYARLDEKVDSTNTKIDRTNEIVSDVRETVGMISGQLQTLTGALEQERQVKLEAFKAQKHVEAKKELAAVDDQIQTNEFHRQKHLKLIGYLGTVLGIVATAITLIATKC